MRTLITTLTLFLLMIVGCSSSTTTTTSTTATTPETTIEDANTTTQDSLIETLYGAQLTLNYNYNGATVSDVALMDNNLSNRYLNGTVTHDARTFPFSCMLALPNDLQYDYFCSYLQNEGWYTFGFSVEEEGLLGGFAFVSSTTYYADQEHALEKVLQAPDSILTDATILFHVNTTEGNTSLPDSDSELLLNVQENTALPQMILQDYLCYDYADDATIEMRLNANSGLLTDTYGSFQLEGSYSTDGVRLLLDLSNFGVTYNHIYHLMVNETVDFFQGYLDDGGGYPDLLSCITTRHDETDKVTTVTNFHCTQHGTFSLEPSGWSSFVDNSANIIYGTYYADSANGQFLLHYMSVDTSGNVSLINFPASVMSPTTIEVTFSDGNESCSY